MADRTVPPTTETAFLPPELQGVLTVNTQKDIEGLPEVKGYDFNKGLDYEAVFKTYIHSGFQATNLGLAIDEVNKMIKWRLSDDPLIGNETDDLKIMENREKVHCTIMLGYTSNMASCGIRDVIRYLAQHKMVDCIVTTAGGIEEDFMKCFAPHVMGDFYLKGADLRKKGLNRQGNIIVPTSNYCLFDPWLIELIEELHNEQIEKGTIFSPSMIIARMGEKINNPDSIYYWCWKNNIPVFCPAFTDGALGDTLFFYSHKRKGFIVDLVQDVCKIDSLA